MHGFLEFEVERLKKLLSDEPETWDIDPIQESIKHHESVILGIKHQLYPGFEARVKEAVAMRRGEPT